jgi:hypothetical protein
MAPDTIPTTQDIGTTLAYAGSALTLRQHERQLEELLMQSALMLSSFRRKNTDAGYPFREPAGVGELIRDIDSVFEAKQNAKRGL